MVPFAVVTCFAVVPPAGDGDLEKLLRLKNRVRLAAMPDDIRAEEALACQVPSQRAGGGSLSGTKHLVAGAGREIHDRVSSRRAGAADVP